MTGSVLEIGSGTGHNFKYYNKNVDLTAIELSEVMLKHSLKRARLAQCNILSLRQEDASTMSTVRDSQYDWVIATFVCCVVPHDLQLSVIQQIHRVLKPGGKFKLVEMVYSRNSRLLARQQRISWLPKKLYGAQFDRGTLAHLESFKGIRISKTSFLKDDIYLLIEGEKSINI